MRLVDIKSIDVNDDVKHGLELLDMLVAAPYDAKYIDKSTIPNYKDGTIVEVKMFVHGDWQFSKGVVCHDKLGRMYIGKPWPNRQWSIIDDNPNVIEKLYFTIDEQQLRAAYDEWQLEQPAKLTVREHQQLLMTIDVLRQRIKRLKSAKHVNRRPKA